MRGRGRRNGAGFSPSSKNPADIVTAAFQAFGNVAPERFEAHLLPPLQTAITYGASETNWSSFGFLP